MRISNDPTLLELSHALPVMGNGADDPQYLARRTAGTLRGCYRPAKNANWYVKLSIGGRQLTLGITENGYCASRFADVALVYFWKYRNIRREPLDCDFNYSLAEARLYAQKPIFIGLLQQIEKHLLDSRILSPPMSAPLPSIPFPLEARSLLAKTANRYSVALREACAIIRLAHPEAKAVTDTAVELELQMEKINASLSHWLNI